MFLFVSAGIGQVRKIHYHIVNEKRDSSFKQQTYCVDSLNLFNTFFCFLSCHIWNPRNKKQILNYKMRRRKITAIEVRTRPVLYIMILYPIYVDFVYRPHLFVHIKRSVQRISECLKIMVIYIINITTY